MNRFKKILKYTGILAGTAIGIMLILNALYIRSTGRRLERQVVALREAGEPVQIADLAPEPIASEENAAVMLRRAAGDVRSMHNELAALYPGTVYPSGPLDATAQEKLQAVFEAYPKALPLLEQAAACPDYDPELDYTLPPADFADAAMERSADHRMLYRVLRARCAWLVSKGRSDEALATTILMLRLSRHLEREPLIIGYLVTLACKNLALAEVNEVLQAGPVSPESRQALDAELVLHDNMEGYRWALRSERTYGLAATRELFARGAWFTRGMANAAEVRLLEVMEQYLEDASRPYAEVVAERGSAPSAGRSKSGWFALIELLKPALDAAREAAERMRAMGRSLRVLNALQAQVKAGERVPRLEDLRVGQARLGQAATRDPFNGQPLKVKGRPAGWTVYSVGQNLVDDGGKVDGRTDVGVGPSAAKGG